MKRKLMTELVRVVFTWERLAALVAVITFSRLASADHAHTERAVLSRKP